MNQTTGKVHPRKPPDHLNALWDDLLSRLPERVRAAYASMAAPEQKAVLTHLQRMVSESGWQASQRASARAALKALENQAK